MSLQEMRDMRICDVDPAALADIGNVSVDISLPKRQRMADTIKQMRGNPYFFISKGKLVVKMSHIDTSVSIDERFESYLRTL